MMEHVWLGGRFLAQWKPRRACEGGTRAGRGWVFPNLQPSGWVSACFCSKEAPGGIALKCRVARHPGDQEWQILIQAGWMPAKAPLAAPAPVLEHMQPSGG